MRRDLSVRGMRYQYINAYAARYFGRPCFYNGVLYPESDARVQAECEARYDEWMIRRDAALECERWMLEYERGASGG